jgi:hypothetical protein
MRTPKGYTDITQVQNYLLITVDSGFPSQVSDWIAKIEDFIDAYTGRNFKADTTASARLFDGHGTNSLVIDDCVEISKVEYGISSPLTEIASGDYLKYPANVLPITKLMLRNSNFPQDLQNVSITAKWGYSVNVPADIEFVATVFAAGVINYSLNADGEVASMTIGRYSVAYKDEKQWQDFDRANKILDMYRRIRLN